MGVSGYAAENTVVHPVVISDPTADAVLVIPIVTDGVTGDGTLVTRNIKPVNTVDPDSPAEFNSAAV